jgi:hypothetical protein
MPSYASSPWVQQLGLASFHHVVRQPPSSENLGRLSQFVSGFHHESPPYLHPQELLGHQPLPGSVERILLSFLPVEQESGPFDVRERQVRVPVLLREVVEAIVGILGVAIAGTDMNANVSAKLREAS